MSTSMGTIITAQIELVAPRAELHFFDQQSVQLAQPLTPLAAWTQMMAKPLPLMALAFSIRDAISARFGIKRIGGFSGITPGFVQAGDKLDFFRVETVTDTVLSLSERDRHLDVLTCLTTIDKTLTITTSVKVHNHFGRIYMIPVGPAHTLIARAMLRRLCNTLN
jgi:hypothetical protein